MKTKTIDILFTLMLSFRSKIDENKNESRKNVSTWFNETFKSDISLLLFEFGNDSISSYFRFFQIIKMVSFIRLFFLYLMALFYIVAGVLHFTNPEFYLAIMPHYLPYHLELVYLSGVAEIICGLFLFSKKTRALGAWLTIALLIAVCKCFFSHLTHE